jgi:sporulation protein YabP
MEGKSMIVEEKRTIENNNFIEPVVQNIVLENRQKLSISGVKDVLSFDDQVVIIATEMGLLTVKGENLKINKLNIDTSEVKVEGKINSFAYSENQSKSESGLFGKIFK